MVNYVVSWFDVSGRPLDVQYYEYKKDALAAVAYFVGRGYRVEITKPTF